jgi:hypothetical protein
MIESYMNDLDVLISASASIVEIDIIRRDIRDTGLEKTALFRYRIKLIDESLIEITERILEEGGRLITTKYRYHWQSGSGKLIKRWDNAPHHPEIDTFPDHLHDGSEENIKSFRKMNVLDILTDIINGL